MPMTNEFEPYTKDDYLESTSGYSVDNLKKESKNASRSKDINIYLFFDLLQISEKIIDMTNSDDIIVLIGDTPSYLKPFLEQERKIYNLAFSKKPYSVIDPPYGEGEETGTKCNADVYLGRDGEQFGKEILNEKYYFEYLNKKTFMTRTFVKLNWDKIILIDNSAGTSIHGVSIFFNRYVKNIIAKNIRCIEGSVPMKFINLRNEQYTNLPLEISQKYFPDNYGSDNAIYYNHIPRLIIILGDIPFLHQYDFLIREAFPRYVPIYGPESWIKEPDFDRKYGIKSIEKLKILLIYYHNFKKNNEDLHSLFNLLKSMPETSSIIVNYVERSAPDLQNILNLYFKQVNTKIILHKYDNVYHNKKL